MAGLRSNTSFVRLFLGRVVTNAGDSLYYIGAMWLVYELTGSSFYTGVAAFLVGFPTSLQFLFGPLVDRWDLQGILVRTQVIQSVVVLVIPLAAVTGHLSVWVVLLVLPILSFLNQLVYPAHSAALPRIVDEDQLVRGNTLFSVSYQGAEMVFNAVGGLLLSIVSATALFVVDSVSFAIAALLFSGVVVPALNQDGDDENDESYLTDLRTGFEYVRGSLIMWIVASSMVANFGSGAVLAVLPEFADSLGGPETYGLLMAAIAGGTLVGAVAASLIDDWSYGPVSIVGDAFSGLALFVALTVPGRLATIAFVFVAVVPLGIKNVMFSSMVQSSVDDAFLGRVQSTVQSLVVVMMPVGNLLGGAIAEAFSPVIMMYVLAGLFVLQGVYFLAHPGLRSLPAVSNTDEETLGLRSPSEQ